MGKPPRRPKVQFPSPLQQVHFTRPLSQPPQEMGLVRDPAFWKRFSTAVHQADGDSERGSATTSSLDMKDPWLLQQHKEKRRCRVLCMIITLLVVLIIVAAAGCGVYFTNHVK